MVIYEKNAIVYSYIYIPIHYYTTSAVFHNSLPVLRHGLGVGGVGLLGALGAVKSGIEREMSKTNVLPGHRGLGEEPAILLLDSGILCLEDSEELKIPDHWLHHPPIQGEGGHIINRG